MTAIPEGELAVMEVLWAESPLTAQDVTDRVEPARGWQTNTVKTMLSRLLAKGVLAHEEDGRRFRYRPTISRQDYAARETRLVRSPHELAQRCGQPYSTPAARPVG